MVQTKQKQKIFIEGFISKEPPWDAHNTPKTHSFINQIQFKIKNGSSTKCFKKNLVKKGLAFARDLSQQNSAGSFFIFSADFTSFGVLLFFP